MDLKLVHKELKTNTISAQSNQEGGALRNLCLTIVKVGVFPKSGVIIFYASTYSENLTVYIPNIATR